MEECSYDPERFNTRTFVLDSLLLPRIFDLALLPSPVSLYPYTLGGFVSPCESCLGIQPPTCHRRIPFRP